MIIDRSNFLISLAATSLLLVSSQPLEAQKKQVEEEKKPWWDAPQPRFSKSELGGVFTGTIDMRGDVKVSNRTIFKAVAVRLGKGGAAGTMLFDTEMMRMACAVPDKPVMFNTYRDGLGGAGHWVGSPYLFTAESGPAWADEGGSFDDVRKGKKAGPLPRSWAHYRGLYRHGERVVFSYRINGTGILDMPWIEEVDGIKVFTRTMEIKPSESMLILRLCQTRDNSGSPTSVLLRNRATPGIEVAKKDDHWHLGIKPRKETIRLKLMIGSVPAAQSDRFLAAAGKVSPAETLSRSTAGGPPRHPNPLVTSGTIGKEKGPYVLDTITPPFDNPDKILFRFGGHDFFSNGDIAVCSIDGDVWRVSGIDQGLQKVTWRRYATGLFQPLGLKIVDDRVHVLGRDQITRLHDLNGSGEADFYECFNNGCRIGKHVHEYATGLETDPEGNFYYVKGHGANNEHAGTLLKVSPDGSEIEVVATGFRWPNGSGAGPDGELTVADQQGTWVPSSRVDLVRKGGFYGFMNAHHREKAPTSYDGPLCWIPHKVDNSCGGQTWNTSSKWGPFKGHMLHCSYGKCTLFLVLQENIGGVDQAGIYQFPFKFQSGGMRARFSPHDGQLYVSGLKGWQTSGAKDGCLQRVRYTGAKVVMPRSLNIHKNGIRIGFTQKVDRELAEDLDSWQIEQWNYQWTKRYGSKEYKVSNPSEVGHDKVEISSARLLEGGTEVFLEIRDLAPVMQMKIAFDLETIDGDEMIGALHNTIHALGPAL